MRASGGGGGLSTDPFTKYEDDSNDDETQQNSENVVTTNDPFSGGGGGGKTGSEIMAEAGDPSAVATIDPHVSSVEEKMKEDGAQSTVNTFTDMAQDGDDPDDGTTFDQIPDNEEGAKTLQNTAETFAKTAQKAQQNDSDDNNVPDKATTAAKNAANAVAESGERFEDRRDGSSGPGGLFASVFAFMLSLASSLFGGGN